MNEPHSIDVSHADAEYQSAVARAARFVRNQPSRRTRLEKDEDAPLRPAPARATSTKKTAPVKVSRTPSAPSDPSPRSGGAGPVPDRLLLSLARVVTQEKQKSEATRKVVNDWFTASKAQKMTAADRYRAAMRDRKNRR